MFDVAPKSFYYDSIRRDLEESTQAEPRFTAELLRTSPLAYHPLINALLQNNQIVSTQNICDFIDFCKARLNQFGM